MSPSSEESDAKNWHKRFAMSCNNRAWELSVQARTAAQDGEMLDVAHASAWHWAQVGSELNVMRANMLLAEVHALLGMGPSSLSFAEDMRRYFSSRETPDWELAFMHAIHAHAAHAAGRPAEHRQAYDRAVAALGAIADEQDREIVERTFSQVPPP